MVFNSLEFLPFALIVLAGHFFLPWRFGKFFLLLANYIFYASFNPPFVIFLFLTTVFDFIFARAIYYSENASLRRRLLIGSVILNISVLAYFKYINFFLDNLILLGFTIETRFDIIVPLGISFYIFHSMSYVFDMYKKRLKPSGFLEFALFVSFFTQLVAGPIVRARHLLPQLRLKRLPNFRKFNLAIWLIVLGYFKKIVVADGVANYVGMVFTDPQNYLDPDRFLALLGFAAQIYCDFSGYTDIAIGLSLLLGITLRRNFRLPYLARGFSDYWKRWHISLSTWIRDYLYFTMGGSRHGKLRNSFNVLATMGISGLWHGASWMFVTWGLLHGLYLLVERMFTWVLDSFERRFNQLVILRQTFIYKITVIGITFYGVLAAWIFFRAESIPDAILFLESMVLSKDTLLYILPWHSSQPESVYIFFFLAFHLLYYPLRLVRGWFRMGQAHWTFYSVAISLMMFCIITSWSDRNLFIYFQF